MTVATNLDSGCFWRNLHRWQKFYTAADSDGIDKYHLCGDDYDEMFYIDVGFPKSHLLNRYAHNYPK